MASGILLDLWILALLHVASPQVFGMTASLLSQEQTRVGRFYNTVSQWYNTDLLSCASHCDLERTCVAFQHDPLNGGCATTDRYYSYPVTLERPTNYITWSKNSTWHEWREFSTTMAQENGSAEQVTTLADGENDPQRCIDGNYFSECHTALGIEANTAYATWWRVYLNYIVRVTGIQIWNAAYIPEWPERNDRFRGVVFVVADLANIGSYPSTHDEDIVCARQTEILPLDDIKYYQCYDKSLEPVTNTLFGMLGQAVELRMTEVVQTNGNALVFKEMEVHGFLIEPYTKTSPQESSVLSLP